MEEGEGKAEGGGATTGGFEKDEGLALTFAEKAARKGLPSAEFAMGYYAEVGVGQPKDVKKAIVWYERVRLLSSPYLSTPLTQTPLTPSLSPGKIPRQPRRPHPARRALAARRPHALAARARQHHAGQARAAAHAGGAREAGLLFGVASISRIACAASIPLAFQVTPVGKCFLIYACSARSKE